jgi:hypothetical protein
VVVDAASKGPNLQIQCAVSSAVGTISFRTTRGSIKMEQNAAFIEGVYEAIKRHPEYELHYACKKVVLVLDNAPCHSQTETRVDAHDDMVILRLGPYSPMCNPIEGCFSVLEARVKDFIAMHRHELSSPREELDENGKPLSMLERRMRMLEGCANGAIEAITPRLVTSMELHCRDAVNAALRMEDMQYGT